MAFLQNLLDHLHIKKPKVEGTQLGNLHILPLEIRQQIYRNVLGDPHPITLDFRRKILFTKPSTYNPIPSLLKCSKQIRTEALQILRIHLFISALETGIGLSPNVHPVNLLPLWIRQSTVAVSINADQHPSYCAVNRTSFPNLDTLIFGSFGQFERPVKSKCSPSAPASSLPVLQILGPGQTIDGVYADLHDDTLAVAFSDKFLRYEAQLPVRGRDRGYAIHFKRRSILVRRNSDTQGREGDEDIELIWDFDKQIFVERVNWQKPLP